MTKKKVAIIGAGPAGTTCAYELVKAGIDATLFDHKAPWEKPCGGMIHTSALFEESIFADFDSTITKYGSLKVISPRNFVKVIDYDNPICIVNRYDLNKFLIEKAIINGTGHVKEKVLTINFFNGYWNIETTRSTYSADILIGADGVNSIVRKKVSNKISKNNLALACGYNLSNNKQKESVIQFTNFEGYFWIFPNNSFISVGIGARLGKSKGATLFSHLDSFIHEHNINGKIINRWAALVPIVASPEFFDINISDSAWLLIGDAAGHVNPLIGEGIFYAVKSGICAAQAIIEGNLKSYENKWKKDFGDDLIVKTDYFNKVLKSSADFGPEMFGAMMFKALL